MLRRACGVRAIRHHESTSGRAAAHMGGHIERLLGTLLRALHALLGRRAAYITANALNMNGWGARSNGVPSRVAFYKPLS